MLLEQLGDDFGRISYEKAKRNCCGQIR